MPPEGYLEGVRALCDRWDLLMIVDETMTGMGRTGKWLAIEHWGIEPDIIVMGKALGAYCPLAATIFSEHVARSFEANLFGHGQSYSGHALACAGALVAIEVLVDDGLLGHAEAMGGLLETELKALGERFDIVGDVRGLGLFWTLELVVDRASRSALRRATEKYETTVVQKVADFLLEERQVYVPSDKFGLWIVPPLVVNETEIDFLVSALEAALRFAQKHLQEESA